MKLIQPRNAALLLLVIVFAFGMRAVILSSEPRLGVDGRERYEKLARNIQEGRGFSKATDSGYVPEDFDQPGYPYFLAAIYSLPAGGDRAVVVVQALLELFTLLLVVLICRRLGLPQSVQIGALLVALICPFLPRFGNMIMTEVPATFLVTLACYFLVSAVTTANAKWWVLAGLAGGASLLVRADTIIAVGFMCVGAILLVALTNGRSALSAALFLCLSLLVVMAPWMARNYRAFNEPRPLGGTAGQTHSAYVDWLNTWADDPVYLDRYWWNALNSTCPAEFPAGKLVGDEKQKADNALALARSQGTFAGKPMQVFAGLAENAKHDRPWQSYVAVPVRRFAMTWIRMPSSIEGKPGRAVAYTFWVALLGLTLIGLYGALSWQNRTVYIPLMMIFGRAVLPLLSFLATEPRYMLEALPACFILSVLGLFMTLGIRPRSLKFEAYQMFQTDSVGNN